MAKSDAFEAAFLDLLYLNIAIPLLGDASGLLPSGTAGSLFFALHTADPGEGGSQTTNEIAYTSYARVAVPRSGAGFVRTGNSISPFASVTFPAGTGGSGTATFFSTGIATSGAGMILHRGAISPVILCGDGVTPRLGTGTVITES